ncbi:MAG: L-proline amide hydrolase [Solirubrobacteraceae bacterium]|jgi:L-proline amide hydrolase|nr:L-proline amide hydrolase [Solirubrobacteraceae bacterium]
MEGYLDHDGHRTWYRVVGELDPAAERAPAIICHGGPGATHDYVEPIAELHRSGRPCVLYDQLGNGRSDHLPDADPSFWTVDRFERELGALAAHLGIDGRYHVIGQSWGGMLALLHALERPPGLLSVVAADSPASVADFVAGCNELLDTLDADVRETIRAGERDGEVDTPEFQAAVMEFYKRFVCRLDPWPDDVVRSFAAMESDPTVYRTMNGPTEFTVVGTIRDFDVTDRLGEIEVPVLLVSGAYDEVRPHVVAKMHDRLRDSRWELFEDSSHMPHVEEPERFLDLVDGFLAQAERAD